MDLDLNPDPDLDADADPAFFVIDLPKMQTKNSIFKKFAYYFLKVHVLHFQR